MTLEESGQVRQVEEERRRDQDGMVDALGRLIELKDPDAWAHARRAAELGIALARKLELAETELVTIRRGILLHDIGKIGIPDSILFKPALLSFDEWDLMRTHPRIGYDILKPMAFLEPVLPVILYHHEQWDGGGYPELLKAEQIPFSARLATVATVWDALVSDRPYHKAWSPEKARGYMAQKSGSLFDPAIVASFLEMLDEEK